MEYTMNCNMRRKMHYIKLFLECVYFIPTEICDLVYSSHLNLPLLLWYVAFLFPEQRLMGLV